MLGVLVNVATVLIGGTAGLLLKRGIPEKFEKAIMFALALCTIYIGISGSLEGGNTLVMIFSMVIGTAVGTLINIDGGLNAAGKWLETKFAGKDSSSTIAEGFVTASLLFCVGAMTIVGSLEAGLTGDNTMLYTKSLLDLCSSAILASTLGIGVLFSVATVLVLQGGIVLLAGLLGSVLTTAAITEMTCVGSLIIVGLGLNMLGVTKIKVADMLPAILFAPVFLAAYNLVAGMLG